MPYPYLGAGTKNGVGLAKDGFVPFDLVRGKAVAGAQAHSGRRLSLRSSKCLENSGTGPRERSAGEGKTERNNFAGGAKRISAAGRSPTFG
jgi:hypothetical protein